MKLTFTIWGQTPTKKTGQMIRKGKRGQRWVAPSVEYQEWEKDAAKQLMCQRTTLDAEFPITCQIQVKFTIYRHGFHEPDLSNLIQSCEDALQKGGVIKNDSLIKSLDGSRSYLGVVESEARAEIEITPMGAG